MLKKVRIRNFRSLVDVEVDLDPVTVLIGRSGTGKTNFVDAIRFLRDLLWNPARGHGRFHSAEFDSIVSATAPLPGVLSFQITFDTPAHASFTYTLHWTVDRAGRDLCALQHESLRLNDTELFSHDGQRWQTAPSMISAPEPRKLPVIEEISGVAEVSDAYGALTVGIGCYDFESDVAARGRDSAANPRPLPGLDDEGQNYLEAFGRICDDPSPTGGRAEIISRLSKLNRSVKSVGIKNPERQQVTVAHVLADSLLPLPLAQESEGFRRFFAHMVAMYQIPPKLTLIFEEPEKGIYPFALAMLREEFLACPEAGRGQVILTTHSPELLNDFPPTAIRVVEIKDQQTRIGTPTADQLESVRDGLLRAGELLTVDEAVLRRDEPEAVAR